MGIGIFCYTRLFIRLKSVGLSLSETLFIRLLIRIFASKLIKYAYEDLEEFVVSAV